MVHMLVRGVAERIGLLRERRTFLPWKASPLFVAVAMSRRQIGDVLANTIFNKLWPCGVYRVYCQNSDGD